MLAVSSQPELALMQYSCRGSGDFANRFFFAGVCSRQLPIEFVQRTMSSVGVWLLLNLLTLQTVAGRHLRGQRDSKDARDPLTWQSVEWQQSARGTETDENAVRSILDF